MKFVVTAVQGGAKVAYFPVSKAANASLRQAFGTAVSFVAEERAWHLKGSDALARLRGWVRENKAAIEASTKALADQVAGVKASVSALTESDRDAARRYADANPVTSPLVSRSDDGSEWLVRTPYDPRVVEAMKEGVIGARFDRKAGAWRVPTTQTEALRAEMPGIELAAAEAPPARGPRPSTRRLFVLADAPALDEPTRIDDVVAVPVEVGKAFEANASTLRDHPHVKDHLGERVAYVYYRPATPEEVEAYDVGRAAPSP